MSVPEMWPAQREAVSFCLDLVSFAVGYRHAIMA